MYRSTSIPLSLQNCLILQNRTPLVYVPKQFTFYFVNSKKRFFLYFKHKDEMEQIIKIFQRQKIKFYQRKSMFPDRQQQQQIVYHGNYKYKKKDIRRNLKFTTQLRDPRIRFYDDQQDSKIIEKLAQLSFPCQTQSVKKFEQVSEEPQKIQQKRLDKMDVQETEIQYAADFGQIKIKNKQVLNIIRNMQVMKALFKVQKGR